MRRGDAYKYLLLGATVKGVPKLKNDRMCFAYFLGSTVPLDAFYRKNPGNGIVVWSSRKIGETWYECAAYDPIFIDEIEEFDWEVV